MMRRSTTLTLVWSCLDGRRGDHPVDEWDFQLEFYSRFEGKLGTALEMLMPVAAVVLQGSNVVIKPPHRAEGLKR